MITITKALTHGVAAALAVATLSLPALAGAAEGKAVTLKGEVLDSTCFFTKGASGAGHKECARKCLQGGAAATFKAEDGTVYLLLADHGKEKALEDAKKKAGETVSLTGTVQESGGMKALVVSEAK